jgi:hypothetical protein
MNNYEIGAQWHYLQCEDTLFLTCMYQIISTNETDYIIEHIWREFNAKSRIHIRMHALECVCVRERERDRQKRKHFAFITSSLREAIGKLGILTMYTSYCSYLHDFSLR